MPARLFWIPCLLLVFAFGCSSAPKRLGPGILDEAKAREAACGRFERRPARGLSGTIAMSLKNPGSQGQASADVLLTPPDRLRLEGHDPFGATVATFALEGDRYEIDTRKLKGGLRETGVGYWSGIPISWVRGMFAGRLPCPPAASGAKGQVDGEGAWIVTVPGKAGEERFEYAFGLGDDGRPWVSSLHWTRLGAAPLEAKLEIQEWDEKEAFPSRWEVKGARTEVKIRWKNRAWAN